VSHLRAHIEHMNTGMLARTRSTRWLLLEACRKTEQWRDEIVVQIKLTAGCYSSWDLRVLLEDDGLSKTTGVYVKYCTQKQYQSHKH
jgi:hypothetical protein